MPTYNIVMKQGITVPDLGGDTLVTGPGQSTDGIQSCSAVIFFSSATRGAGLYHFPSGDIAKDMESRSILSAMCNAVHPTECYIAFGTAGNDHSKKVRLGDPFSTQLHNYVVGIIPTGTRLRQMPVIRLVAAISQHQNVAKIDVESPAPIYANRTNLRGYAAAFNPDRTALKDGPQDSSLRLLEPRLPDQAGHVTVFFPRVQLPGIYNLFPLCHQELERELVPLDCVSGILKEQGHRVPRGDLRFANS